MKYQLISQPYSTEIFFSGIIKEIFRENLLKDEEKKDFDNFKGVSS